MGNFQGGNRGGSGGGYRGGNGGGGGRPFRGPRDGGGRRDDREVSMHKAVCDECHKPCEVPFRPSSDKPIYCNECFSGKRKDDDRGPRRDFGDRGPKRDFGNRPDSRPSFHKQGGDDNGVKKQLEEMNSKLDRLISALDKMSLPKETTKKEVEVKAVLPKTTETKKPVKKVEKVKDVKVKKVVKKAVVKKKK